MQLQLIRDAVPHAVIIAGICPRYLDAETASIYIYVAFDIDRFRFISDIGFQHTVQVCNVFSLHYKIQSQIPKNDLHILYYCKHLSLLMQYRSLRQYCSNVAILHNAVQCCRNFANIFFLQYYFSNTIF